MNNNYDITMLKYLINSQNQYYLLNTMYRIFLKTYDESKITRGNNSAFLYVEGTDPVLLVAHLDTVHKPGKRDIFYDSRKKVLWSPTGLGADDRAGVFAIIKLLQKGLKPHILLTTDEEIGGYGAMAATAQMSDDAFEGKCKFMIELDRCNEKDSVYYYETNKDFKDFINSFGFVEDIGSFSDICTLSPKWGMSSVNLSVGYRLEHTYAEHLYLRHLYGTINKVSNIIIESRKAEVPFFNFLPDENSYFDTNIPIYYDVSIPMDRIDVQKILKTSKKIICPYCKKVIQKGMYVLEDFSSTSYLCEDCFNSLTREEED